MYPRNFQYRRAASLDEAMRMLGDLGPDAKLLAGGQSLIPLMKLRMASPPALVDIGHIDGLNYVRKSDNGFAFGALTRHAEIARSAVANDVAIIHDCAAGIADVQVRNWGTLVGSVAEADPTGDWAPVLLSLGAEVVCVGPKGERTVPLPEFITDAFSTSLAEGELIREVRVAQPKPGSGGAYIAFKRCAPVYASASAAAHVTLEQGTCRSARIFLGAVGLTAIHASDAEKVLEGKRVDA